MDSTSPVPATVVASRPPMFVWPSDACTAEEIAQRQPGAQFLPRYKCSDYRKWGTPKFEHCTTTAEDGEGKLQTITLDCGEPTLMQSYCTQELDVYGCRHGRALFVVDKVDVRSSLFRSDRVRHPTLDLPMPRVSYPAASASLANSIGGQENWREGLR